MAETISTTSQVSVEAGQTLGLDAAVSVPAKAGQVSVQGETNVPEETETEQAAEQITEQATPVQPTEQSPSPRKRGRPRKNTAAAQPTETDTSVQPAGRTAASMIGYHPGDVLTIDPNRSGTEQEDDAQMFAWHELQNSRIKNKILTGTLSSMEHFQLGDDQFTDVAVVNYKGYRVMIPVSEMNIIMDGTMDEAAREARVARITANMVGCDIDFIVNQLDEASKSVVGSRKRAMQRKIRDFYMEPSERKGGRPMINAGDVVEARIVAVAEAALRLEVFGAECFVRAFDMSNTWISDARKKYYIGQKVLVRVSEVSIDGDNHVKIQVEGKSLKKEEYYSCSRQSRYLGTVTGFSKGTYFVSLDVGVNAVAHSCDGVFPLPQKNDKVAFICTRMDEETHVAVGIIVRIVQPSIN